MEFRHLGQTDIKVSRICLGTMTWGVQNTESDAHAQLDYALSSGVNFIDTAELYPIPPSADTYTLTEQYIGRWLEKRNKRDDVIIATKIAGPARHDVKDQHYIRGGSHFTRSQIHAACEASLKRLRTDYIDLYQLHWPERSVNYFGTLGLDTLHPDREATAVPLEESLSALQELVQAGKIRHFGLSNETPWGVMHCVHLAKTQQFPRVVSVQNPYNLLNRSYEVGLSEISLRETISLLAYSPLAFGTLTGKYRHGALPQNSRLALSPRFVRYQTDQGLLAIEEYAAIAEKANLSLAHLSLGFILQRSFVTSVIIGATTLKQLKENINAQAVTLSSETLALIDEVHRRISNPCP